jgi:hypothetical protein
VSRCCNPLESPSLVAINGFCRDERSAALLTAYRIPSQHCAGSNGSDFDSYPLLHANQASAPALQGVLAALLTACANQYKHDGGNNDSDARAGGWVGDDGIARRVGEGGEGVATIDEWVERTLQAVGSDSRTVV